MDIESLRSLLDVGMPIWILTGGALLCLLWDALFSRGPGASLFLIGGLTIVFSMIVAFRQWISGISASPDLLLFDRLSHFFLVMILFVGLITLCNIYSYLKLKNHVGAISKSLLPGASVSLILFSLIGMTFLFASDHLIVNFVGLETMSLAIYILVGSNRKDVSSNEAAMKYYVMGSVASAILLYGIALLYGAYGSFRLIELAAFALEPTSVLLPKIGLGLVFAGIAFKMALVPFHFWVPDVYQGAPTPVTGFMSTGVKIAAFAFFIRVITSLNPIYGPAFIPILGGIVVATLTVGNVAAIAQDNVKRMLAYSSIAHAGYLFLGLLVGFKEGKFDPSALSAVLFYLMAYSFMTLGAFAVLSLMVREGKELTDFSDLTGMGSSHPVLAATFSLFMISLLGIPATAGFVAKYAVFSQAVSNGYVGLAVFAVLTTLVSAYYYLRPVVMMYFGNDEGEPSIFSVPFPLMISLMACAVAVLYLGIFPTDYFHMAQFAASVFK